MTDLFSPGSSDRLDWHCFQQVDLSLQVKVGWVVGGHEGAGGPAGHVQVLVYTNQSVDCVGCFNLKIKR